MPRALPGRLAETQITLTGGEQPGPFGRKDLAGRQLYRRPAWPSGGGDSPSDKEEPSGVLSSATVGPARRGGSGRHG